MSVLSGEPPVFDTVPFELIREQYRGIIGFDELLAELRQLVKDEVADQLACQRDKPVGEVLTKTE